MAIEILTAAPIRISNLALIRLDKHLLKIGKAHHLVIPAEEVKNKKSLEFVLAPSTVALLELYIKAARPKLDNASSPFLFPGRFDGHKQTNHMSNLIAKVTAAEIGVRITAYQFRHIAGFLYLRENPGCYEVVRQLLGHKSITTTIRFYTALEQDAAIGLYDQYLQKRRNELTEAHIRRAA